MANAELVKVETTNSIKLTKTTRGYTWEIKIRQDETISWNGVMKQLNIIDKDLKGQFENGQN